MGTILGQEFWRWVGGLLPQLRLMSIYWRCSLEVPSSHFWAFWLMTSLLSSGSLLLPGSLGLFRDLPDPHALLLPIFFHSPGPLLFKMKKFDSFPQHTVILLPMQSVNSCLHFDHLKHGRPIDLGLILCFAVIVFRYCPLKKSFEYRTKLNSHTM